MSKKGEWPADRHGFRQRGLDMTRIETFTDAAFAFALTLLVISVESVPSSHEEMLNALTGIPAFAFSFALLILFWYGHWQWSRRFGLEDLPTILLSTALVFVALVYVYPLKFLASLVTYWLTAGRLSPNAVIESSAQLNQVFLVYGIGYVAMAAILALLNGYALRRKADLELNGVELVLTRGARRAWTIQAGVGLLSAAVALLGPTSLPGLPGWAYMLLAILMPLHGARLSREHQKAMAMAGDESAGAAEREP